ncbi:MAG TPA: hypothetical protein VK887_04500 [Pseudonocardiaceae bacterium]|nr:hypothetical protein [Pseudonocardiaceae bacterium]
MQEQERRVVAFDLAIASISAEVSTVMTRRPYLRAIRSGTFPGPQP